MSSIKNKLGENLGEPRSASVAQLDRASDFGLLFGFWTDWDLRVILLIFKRLQSFLKPSTWTALALNCLKNGEVVSNGSIRFSNLIANQLPYLGTKQLAHGNAFAPEFQRAGPSQKLAGVCDRLSWGQKALVSQRFSRLN